MAVGSRSAAVRKAWLTRKRGGSIKVGGRFAAVHGSVKRNALARAIRTKRTYLQKQGKAFGGLKPALATSRSLNAKRTFSAVDARRVASQSRDRRTLPIFSLQRSSGAKPLTSWRNSQAGAMTRLVKGTRHSDRAGKLKG